jgi:hypothetical protein
VSVGIDHDTASFAVHAIRRWWRQMGRAAYSRARSLSLRPTRAGATGRLAPHEMIGQPFGGRRMGVRPDRRRRGLASVGPGGDRRCLSLAEPPRRRAVVGQARVSVVLELLRGADLERVSRRHRVSRRTRIGQRVDVNQAAGLTANA